MSKLRDQIKEVLKENSSGNMNLEAQFWAHVKEHVSAFGRNPRRAQMHLDIAQRLARGHFDDTETKIDGGNSSKHGIPNDVINQFNSRYVNLG